MIHYLSDKLFFGINLVTALSAKVGDLVHYDLSIRPSGVNPSTLSEYSYEIVYSGSVNVLGGDQYIYLNDLLATHMYDHEYIKAPVTPSTTVLNTPYPTPTVISKNPYFLIDVKIDFPGRNYSKQITSILQCYLSPGDIGEDIDMASSTSKIYNILNQRTRLVPRVPRLQGSDCNFWLGIMASASKGFWASNNRYMIVGVGKNGESTQYRRVTPSAPSFVRNLTGTDYLETIGNDYTININGVSDYEAKEIWLSDVNFDVKVKLADVDDCPSKYYLIWMDRSGAYQCQPFNKRSVRKENITRTQITNLLEENRNVSVSIRDSWTLNTDWLGEEEYKAYESIITSPYLYLYDTEVDRGYWVNCKDNNWEEKTVKNNKRLFNMSVNVETIAPINIIY